MDFFEHQDRARRRTSLLVVYFGLAVVLIVAAVYLAVLTLFRQAASPAAGASAPAWWQPDLALVVTLVTLAIIGLGTLFKVAQLRQGGAAVARMLGARAIAPGTAETDERRLLNVVEEIALASGTPIPGVFVLDDEPGINAFAAGYATGDAVVAVTRGCLDRLTRDELQGVIAHEFSHVLNGDMRLNIRLMGLLNGILVIALIGYWTLRLTAGGSRRVSGGSRRKGGGAAAFVLLGLALMAIGYIGVFFGKLIKSAVSRQREFLADAASVQFTRNPAGLAGALKKIGALAAGSRLGHPNAEQASHLYFANGLGASLFGLMATHPPLAERVRRIDPAFDGRFDAPEPPTANPMPAAAAPPPGQPTPHVIAMTPASVLGRVGRPQAAQLAFVAALLEALPDALRQAARDPVGAQAVIFGLLLNSAPAVLLAQDDALGRLADPPVRAALRALEPALAALPPAARLPLAESALAALRGLAPPAAARFRAALRALIEADASISLFEYMLERMVERRLDAARHPAERTVIQYYDLAPLLPAAAVLLSTLAYFGQADPAAAAEAVRAGAERLGARGLALLPPERCGLPAADSALRLLASASPFLKRRVLDAGVATVAADGTTTVQEAELLRAVADALDCPMPPFTPSAAA